jgi:hypothetical protein
MFYAINMDVGSLFADSFFLFLVTFNLYCMDVLYQFKLREMIFVHNNFCNNFLCHTHIIFLVSVTTIFVFVSIHTFLCKNVVVTLIDVQIAQILN